MFQSLRQKNSFISSPQQVREDEIKMKEKLKQKENEK